LRKINVGWYKRFLSNAERGESEHDTFKRLYDDWGIDEICLEYDISYSAFHAKRRRLGIPPNNGNVSKRRTFNYLGQLRRDIERYGLQYLIEMNERKRRSYVPTYGDYEDPWDQEV
jgi:hypothetical protein